MTDKVLIDRALLQDLIDDVSDYAESRVFKQVEWKWRTELLEKARALLAAGASEGQADKPAAWLIDWPDEPELGHYFAEAPVDPMYGRSVPLYTNPSAEIAALRERIAGMEKDAERYRYLRGRFDECSAELDFGRDDLPIGECWVQVHQNLNQGKALDDAIDAAIAKEPK